MAFRTVQAIYMPCSPSLVAGYVLSVTPVTSEPSAERPAGATSVTTSRIIDRPEEEPLFLPHALTADNLQSCAPGIARIEERLREAQLAESLDKLRVHLHVKARLVTFKNRQVRHQGPNTRARRLIDLNQEKISATTARYRAARVAKFALAQAGPWELTWRILQPTDIRTMLAEDDPINIRPNSEEGSSADRLLSEGRRQTSWIWMAGGVETEDGAISDDLQDGEFYQYNRDVFSHSSVSAVRVEYLKARARVQRSAEQVALLVEEKRRVLHTLEYEARRWDERVDSRTDNNSQAA